MNFINIADVLVVRGNRLSNNPMCCATIKSEFFSKHSIYVLQIRLSCVVLFTRGFREKCFSKKSSLREQAVVEALKVTVEMFCIYSSEQQILWYCYFALN